MESFFNMFLGGDCFIPDYFFYYLFCVIVDLSYEENSQL